MINNKLHVILKPHNDESVNIAILCDTLKCDRVNFVLMVPMYYVYDNCASSDKWGVFKLTIVYIPGEQQDIWRST